MPSDTGTRPARAGAFDGAGWSDPDTRKAGLIVIGAVLLLVVLGRVFHDVNAA